MNRRGLTMLELVVGMATAAVIAAVSASVIKAGIMTYNYVVRQDYALSNTRKAIIGEGSAEGLIRAGRYGSYFSSINSSSMTVLSSTASIATSFYVSGNNFYKLKATTLTKHAESITALSVSYYNLDSNYLIYQSSLASSALMATALVTMTGQGGTTQRTYKLYSGVKLRNHP